MYLWKISMKMPMQIITTLLLLSLATISLAKGQSGSGNLIYDPKNKLQKALRLKLITNGHFRH